MSPAPWRIIDTQEGGLVGLLLLGWNLREPLRPDLLGAATQSKGAPEAPGVRTRCIAGNLTTLLPSL